MNEAYAKLAQARIKELTDKEIPVGVIKLVFEEIMKKQAEYDFEEKMGRLI